MSRAVLQQALEALENAENSLGSFVSDHGWSQSDMDIMDNTTATIIAVKRALAQPEQEPVLQDIEQYRMQIAGICTAAIGYWKEGDSIHPDYDTLALRDVAKLYAKYDELYTSPPQRQPLRGEQIYEIFVKTLPKLTLGMTYVPEWAIPIVRAIEAAHGIGNKT